MAARWIPPHKRGGNVASKPSNPSTASDANLYSAAEITKHFNPDPVEESIAHRTAGTLNASSSAPDTLSHIVLFYDQHPFWASKREIFCKSNLDLLPPFLVSTSSISTSSIAASSRSATHPPPSPSASSTANENNHGDVPSTLPSIPVFDQRRRHGGRTLCLAGWYRISRVDELAPRSAELVRYLDAKWSSSNGVARARPVKGWQESLAARWAVVTMIEDESRLAETVSVARLEPRAKTVAEVMAEMDLEEKRSKGGVDGGGGGGGGGGGSDGQQEPAKAGASPEREDTPRPQAV